MVLSEAIDDDLAALMTWFGDEQATSEWGGPDFRYPFNEASFREDVRAETLDSFVFRSADAGLLGFGQIYEKLGRGHLARLAVAPEHRGRGIGSDLVKGLCDKAAEVFDCSEHSLFVMRANQIALRCYKRIGFAEAPYPENDGMQNRVMFMVRSSV
jgi:ribosomal protein S18 acetylase RimI-like enzyme